MNLLQAMNHHAKDKTEIINAIGLVFTTVLRPAGWDVLNVLGGANSWMIVNPATGQQQHFRDGGKGCVYVVDHYQWRAKKRTPVELRTRLDVIRWATKLCL
jgi:hypothetical protein